MRIVSNYVNKDFSLEYQDGTEEAHIKITITSMI